MRLRVALTHIAIAGASRPVRRSASLMVFKHATRIVHKPIELNQSVLAAKSYQ